MIHVGKWGRMYDDGCPSDNSFEQERRNIHYKYQQSMMDIQSAQSRFDDFIKKNEKYSDELKREMLKDFKEYIESEKLILLEKRREELY